MGGKLKPQNNCRKHNDDSQIHKKKEKFTKLLKPSREK